jgi:hypothetical protein
MSKTWKERLDKVPREERHHEFKKRKKEIEEELLKKEQNDPDVRLRDDDV